MSNKTNKVKKVKILKGVLFLYRAQVPFEVNKDTYFDFNNDGGYAKDRKKGITIGVFAKPEVRNETYWEKERNYEKIVSLVSDCGENNEILITKKKWKKNNI